MKAAIYKSSLNNPTLRASSRIVSAKFGSVFMTLMISFIVIAAMQAFQLSALLSDAKGIGNDVVELRTEQISILQECAANARSLKLRL